MPVWGLVDSRARLNVDAGALRVTWQPLHESRRMDGQAAMTTMSQDGEAHNLGHPAVEEAMIAAAGQHHDLQRLEKPTLHSQAAHSQCCGSILGIACQQ